MSEPSISTLIQGLKNGDHEAIEKLWSQYFAKLTELAKRRLSGIPQRTFDEEDVAVSVFDSLCRGAAKGNFKTLSDRDDLWALLLTIMKQKTVDRIRYQTRQKRGGGDVRGESVFELLPGQEQIARIEQVLADEPTPESLVMLDDYLAQLFATLNDKTLKQVAQMRGWRATP